MASRKPREWWIVCNVSRGDTCDVCPFASKEDADEWIGPATVSLKAVRVREVPPKKRSKRNARK